MLVLALNHAPKASRPDITITHLVIGSTGREMAASGEVTWIHGRMPLYPGEPPLDMVTV
jgi:hypothetical protein